MEEQRFERQLKLEDEYQAAGYQKIARRDFRNKQKHYGSHTVVGNLLRRELLDAVAQTLKNEYTNKIAKGVNGVGYAQIEGLFTKNTRWHVIAHIGLSTLLDYILVPGTGIRTVHAKIGERIEDQLKLSHFKSADPELFKKCKKDYIRATASYRQKIYSTSKVFKDAIRNREEEGLADEAEAMTWHKWPQDCLLAVGAWIAVRTHGVFAAMTDGMQLLKEVKGHNGKHVIKCYTLGDDFAELEQIHLSKKAQQGTYKDWPMVCPPLDWQGPSEEHPEGVHGGFITNAMTRRYPMVRGWDSDEKTLPSDQAIEALNQLQSVPWKVNQFVYEILQHYYSRGLSINDSDSFRPYMRPEEHDIPKLAAHLVDIPDYKKFTGPQRQKYKDLYKEKQQALALLKEWHNKDADRRSEGEIYRLVMVALERFKNEERFWIPWSFDFRTRMYPINILNPQLGQYINAAMCFADGHPIDSRSEHWLAVHVATTRGFSKETFEGRVAWVHGNLREVTAVATDPLGDGLAYWTQDADEPWMYLAACREYWECFIAKTKTETHIQCGIDATASGLQILGSLMGDESTCELTNVIPTKRPSDLYQTVIDKAIRLIKDEKNRVRIPLDKLTRKVAKSPVMTKSYGSTPHRRRDQVFQACNSKSGLDLDLKREKTNYLADKIDAAMQFVLPGVEFVLGWIQKTALLAMASDPDKKYVYWRTAVGSLVVQGYMVEQLKRVSTVALGTGTYRPCIQEATEEPKLKKIESSTAANVVHSLDASVLQLAIPTLNFAVTAIHDCGYARAGKQMDQLAHALRLGFVEVVQFPVLETFADINGVSQAAQEVKDKKNAEFDYDLILKSPYLFC